MLKLYHGTEIEKTEKIVGSQSFRPSSGDEHWLGDGIYFYEEKMYAIRWLCIVYNRKYQGHTPKFENVIAKYGIVLANIDVTEDRVFDLTKTEYKIIFDAVHKETIKKYKPKNGEMVDGAVLNYMFYRMGYKKKFDIIKAIFIHEDNDISISNTRLAYIPETQYCVVNSSIIKKIEHINILESDKLLFDYAVQYNAEGNGNLIKYIPRRKRRYNA